MTAWERILTYISSVQHLGSVLKSMAVHSYNQELALATINGLSSQCENIITTFNALVDDGSLLTLEIVKSRWL